ncbi:MAG: cytochrome c peroxidase [Bacteroidota bacterium]
MRKICTISFLAFVVVGCICFSFKSIDAVSAYSKAYSSRLRDFGNQQQRLLQCIAIADLGSKQDIEKIKEQINLARNSLKPLDFWMRYLEPIAYKKINGPLPIEWETEVFEKFERPYKREGAGLTLAALYLEEDSVSKDSLTALVQSSVAACATYSADSITGELKSHHHFYLGNRLFLLNLAAIYTTGFECPDTNRIIPELCLMLNSTEKLYHSFNESFPATPLTSEYIALFEKALAYAAAQPLSYTKFDHFTFIKNYINPLFSLNQQFINKYSVISRSFVDYSLNKKAVSIFDKTLYKGQNSKGIFHRVSDAQALANIDRLGKMLFYDPILSGNNTRSCVSCHKPTEYFTDTARSVSLQFNRKDQLERNTPSLINAGFNHLLMQDGKHISLQNQTKDVIANAIEMGGDEEEILKKILNCPDYSKAFKSLLKYTPQETGITLDHIVSAITFYYSRFSNYYAPFDDAINSDKALDPSAKKGFNLFMSKAQCATCHFVPQFNGVKPPFVSSEFEVLGVPEDGGSTTLSGDKGRWLVNAATETLHAFRTGSIRNAEHTGPYMHNGVFKNLDTVIDFYDAGGGAGKGLEVPNQTLSSDSLRLTKQEKADLIAFIKSMNELIPFEAAPKKLPQSNEPALNKRRVGGDY